MRNGNKTDNGVHEVGTEETRLAYQHDTPGQQVEEYLSQIALQNEEKQESARKHFSQVFDNPLKGFPHNEEFEVKEIKEEAELTENYRKLAKHGMGTETPKSVKVGTEIDYYQKDGAKYMGKVTKMSKQSYTVRDDKTKKNYQFMYHDRVKAKKYLKQGDNIGESYLNMFAEEMITYRVKGMQKPEEDKFNRSAKMMGLKITMDKGSKDTVIVMSGTKKKLRDFDAVARGKSSFGDPSTITHFDEK